jgi:hypothetical protein
MNCFYKLADANMMTVQNFYVVSNKFNFSNSFIFQKYKQIK